MENMLTIGQLAKLTNTTPVAIRYYEREGLIPKTTRSKGGYRLYPEELVPRFYFIQNAKSVGFSLEEIKQLLSLQQQKNLKSQAIKNITQSKIDEIKDKIKTLNKMQEALTQWAAACDGKVRIEDCPILERLYRSSRN